MATQSLSLVNPSKQNSKASWERLPNESSRAYAAFIEFKDLGADRTYKKVAEKLKKSVQLIGRWGQKFNWHHRSLDFDEFNEGQLQRRLLARRARARERALETAEILDEKLAHAVRTLKLVTVVKVEGKPDEEVVAVNVAEIARLWEVSRKIQDTILGDGKEDRVAAIHVHIGTRNPKYAHEQPEAMAEARRKAAQERQQQEEEL